MFVLLMIVFFAVLVIGYAHAERTRPVAAVLMGLMCLVLGGRAVALLSDSFSDHYLGSAYAQETLPVTESDPAAEPENDEANLYQPSDAGSDSDATVATSSTPHQLAIEPATSFRYLTTPRPAWVETEPSNSDERFQVAVESGLHVRKRTAQQSLQEEVKSTVDAYVNDYLQSQLASSLTGYSLEESEAESTRTINLRLNGRTYEIANQRFDEQVEFDYGVMNQSHALVKIDQNLRKALDERWSEVRATSRLFQTGLGIGAALLLLGTLFGYLKLDTATRGYYTGRLQFGAAAAILAVVAAGVVFANWIPWM